jgi:hypothetical protein
MKIILKIILNIAIYWNSSDSSDILSCKLSLQIYICSYIYFLNNYLYTNIL